MKLYFQGDLCIEAVEHVILDGARAVPPARDGAVVLAEGETTGHRHAFYESAVTLFRVPVLARDLSPELYIGHLRIDAETAELQHEEHDTITLPRGTYRVRRQREFHGGDVIAEPWHSRVVVD